MRKTKSAVKDKRVAFEIPPELAADYAAVAAMLGTSQGGLGTISARFVIPLLKQRKLVCLNGELKPASKALEELQLAPVEQAA